MLVRAHGTGFVTASWLPSVSYPLAVTRYHADGTRDTAFGTNGSVALSQSLAEFADVADLEVQSDGRILLLATADIGNGGDVMLTELTSTGGLASTFGSSGTAVSN